MTPAAMQQVPLDRVTQTIYARIHAAMTPLRKQLAALQESGDIFYCQLHFIPVKK